MYLKIDKKIPVKHAKHGKHGKRKKLTIMSTADRHWPAEAP